MLHQVLGVVPLEVPVLPSSIVDDSEFPALAHLEPRARRSGIPQHSCLFAERLGLEMIASVQHGCLFHELYFSSLIDPRLLRNRLVNQTIIL